MTIRTSASINGFIASEPRLSFADDGTARFYARVGINHYERLEDGSFTKLEPTYHDLIQFGKGAERSFERFIKGDDILAQGYVRVYTREIDGTNRTDDQFVAKRIAHDPNLTTYTVHRRPPDPGLDAPDHAPRHNTPASPATAAQQPPPPPPPPGPSAANADVIGQ